MGGVAGGSEGGDEGDDAVCRGEAAVEVEERSQGFGEGGEELGNGKGFGSEKGEFLELSVVSGV